MFYYFYGTDRDKARERSRGVLSAMKTKRPGAEYFRMTPDSWNPAAFEEFLSGQGLFERKFIVFADGLFENAEAKEWVLSHVAGIGESENAFVFLEGKTDAASLKKIEKHAQEAKVFEAVKQRASFGGESNIFALADALGSRDKKKLWVLLSEALIRGETPEAISGVLFWQVKSMLAARGAKSAAESGLKPFVFMKSVRYAKEYSEEELRSLSRKIISDYHDAHRGLSDLSVSLERFSLSL